jgi:hypothetical protein
MATMRGSGAVVTDRVTMPSRVQRHFAVFQIGGIPLICRERFSRFRSLKELILLCSSAISTW